MKVLYLISGVGPDARGTTFIQETIFNLSQKEVEATIVSPVYKFHQNWESWSTKKEKKYKVKIIPVNVPNWVENRFSLHLVLASLLIIITAVKLVRKERFDLIHEFTSVPAMFFRLWIFKKIFSLPCVVTLSVYNKTLLGKLFWFKLFDFSKYYLIPNKELITKMILLKINKNKIKYSPPGINLKLFQKRINQNYARKKLRLPNNKFIFSYFGPLTNEKGVKDILEAIKLMEQKLQEKILFVFYILSPQRKMLHEKITREIGLLSFSNLIFREEKINMPTFLSASDCVILPQQTGHGTTIPPISVLETLAARKKIIATKILNNQDLIKNKNIVFIPPNNPKDLAKTIKVVYQGKKDFIDNDLKEFDIDRSVALHLNIYNLMFTKNRSY